MSKEGYGLQMHFFVKQQVRLLSGSQIGKVVKTKYEDGRQVVFVYATDCEGNVILL